MALKSLQQQAKVNLFDFSQTKKPEQQTVESSGYQKRYFSDEQSIVNDMLSKGYSEDIARQTIVNRRQDLLKNRKLEPEEKKMLINMADSGVDMPSAVEMLKKYRQDKSDKQFSEMPLYKQAGKSLFDLSARYGAGITGEIGGFMDFATGGRSETGKQAIEANKLAQESFTTPYVGTAGELTGRGMVDYALTKGAGKVTGLGTKFSTLSPTAQIITGGAGYGALQPIGEKGSEVTIGDIATGAGIGAGGGLVLGKVAIPAITKTVQKGMKYGTAFQKGGVEGLTKSVTRDIKAPMTSIQQGIGQTADTLGTNINRMTKGEINKFKTEIGVSPGKFLNDRGITQTGDELVDTLSKNLTQSRKEADKGLESIAGRFKGDTQEIATDIIDTTTGKYKTIKQDTIKTMLEDNLKNASSKGMSKDSLKMKEFLEKYQEGGLEMKEINEAKRWFNKNNKFSYFADDTTSRKGLVTELDNTIRNWQYNKAKELGFENLKEINKQTKAYYKLLEGVTKWNEGSKGNLPIGLSDWLAFNADPSVFLLKQVAESGKVKTGTLKLLNKLSGRSKQLEVKPALITNKGKNVNNTNNSNSSTNMENVELKNVKPTKSVLSKREKQLINPNSNKNVIPNPNIQKVNQNGGKIVIDKNTALSNAYKESAKKRFETGDFTQTEIRKGYEKLNSLYEGRKVKLQDGSEFEIISKPAYGKVKIKMEDGTIKNIDSESIYRNQKQATLKEVIEYLQGTEYNGYNLKKLLPSNFKEKAQDLVDKTMEKIGGKTNLMGNQGIGADKTALLKGSDDLISEARKYKTFDEFKKSQGQELYHGTSSDFVEFLKEKMGTGEGSDLFGRGIYLTDNNKIADFYAKNAYKISNKSDKVKNIMNTYINKNAKIKDLTSEKIGDFVNELNNWIDNNKGIAPGLEKNKYGRWLHSDMTPGELGQAIVQSGNKGILTKFLEEKGYGGIKFKANQIQQIKGKKGINFVIFNPKNIKTEAQLKQIYEQAQKSKPLKKSN